MTTETNKPWPLWLWGPKSLMYFFGRDIKQPTPLEEWEFEEAYLKEQNKDNIEA